MKHLRTYEDYEIKHYAGIELGDVIRDERNPIESRTEFTDLFVYDIDEDRFCCINKSRAIHMDINDTLQWIREGECSFYKLEDYYKDYPKRVFNLCKEDKGGDIREVILDRIPELRFKFEIDKYNL